MRASYKDAIQWIADNDDTEWLDEKEGHLSVTACLVADVFGKKDENVKRDLQRAISKQGKPE